MQGNKIKLPNNKKVMSDNSYIIEVKYDLFSNWSEISI